MSNFFISLGTITKKLILPLIYIIIYSFVNIYYVFVESNEVTMYLERLGYALGQISTFFISNIIKYKRINPKKKKTSVKQYFKNYSFLFLIDILYTLHEFFTIYFRGVIDIKDYSELYISDCIELILLTIVTHYLLKYQYYIHHIISIGIFLVLYIIIDIIQENFIHTNEYVINRSLLIILADSFYWSYLKYLIENKYYYYLDIIFIIGILDFLLKFFTLIGNIIYDSFNYNYSIYFKFFEFYTAYGIEMMIIHFLIGFILLGLIGSLIEFSILKELSPNFNVISYEISKMPAFIMEVEGDKKWLILILSIFQILSLLFYTEIFEFNFCSLNTNTKKSIMERAKNQPCNDKDHEIDIEGYDFSYAVRKQETEMKEMIEEHEDDD